MKTIIVDLDSIEQNENSRVVYKESDLSELMGSMKQHGLLQAVGVKRLDNGKYEAVFGNRRIMAAKKLGWATIDATVVQADTDNDRDILNLIENFKRQNTSVGEDGRMFQVLRDRGLSETEIAARLGISTSRIKTAVEVFSQIPNEFHGRIINSPKGPQKKGKIGASLAQNILSIRRRNSLNTRETTVLLNYATMDDTTQDHLKMVGPLVRQGFDVQEAVQMADTYKVVTLRILMDRTVIRTLEKAHGVSVAAILTDYLVANRKFKIAKRRGGAHKASKTREALKTA